MPNAFDRIVESGQKKWKRFFMAFYYTSDKLQFFVTCAWCHFFDAHFIIYCNLYEGECRALFGRPHTKFFIDSSISGLVGKKNSLYSKRLAMQFSPRCSSVVFLHFRQTHIHMCINIANIRLHFFYVSLFSCIFALHAFFLSRALFDSLIVKWLYGLVWSVVCYFNFLCLLLTALG